MDLSERQHPVGTEFVRHPWETVRADFFLNILDDAHAVLPTSRVLDVGAGDGFFAQALHSRFPTVDVTAWDTAYTDEELHRPVPAGFRFERQQPSGPWDLVLMMDVLEHVDDELPLLGLARSSLAPGGRLLVSVPAWPALFGMHDSRLRHRRRYKPRDMHMLLERAGFIIVASGGLFGSLIVPRALQVAMAARLGRGSLVAEPLTRELPFRQAIAALLRVDGALSLALSRARLAVPGISFWALCARG